MPRNRTNPADFWTWEAAVDCAPMTRLLFIGLWTFADDHGAQPLRPRTIRMQVFPGDDLDAERMRAMIDELAARGLVRIYEVDGVEYLAVVDWGQIQRVGKCARRRWPAPPSAHADGLLESASSAPAARQAPCPEEDHSKAWNAAIEPVLRRGWPGGPPADTARWIEQWIAAGYDMQCDVLPTLDTVCQTVADCGTPPGLDIVTAALVAAYGPSQAAATI